MSILRIYSLYFFLFFVFDLVVTSSLFEDSVKSYCRNLSHREYVVSKTTQDIHLQRVSALFLAREEEKLLWYVSHFDGILWADEQGWLVHYIYLALQRLFNQRDRLENFLVTSFAEGSNLLQGDLFHQNKFAKLQLETGAAYSLRNRAMEYFLMKKNRDEEALVEKKNLLKKMIEKYPDSTFLYAYLNSPEFLEIYNKCKDIKEQREWNEYIKKVKENQHAQIGFSQYFFLRGDMVSLRNRKSKVQYSSVSLMEGWEEIEVLGVDGDWVSIRCLGERGFVHNSHLVKYEDIVEQDRKRFRSAMKLYESGRYVEAAEDLTHLVRKCRNIFLKERAIALLHKVHIEIRRRAESRNSPYTKYVFMHPKYFCVTKEGLLGDSFLLFNFLKMINPKSPFFRLFQYQT